LFFYSPEIFLQKLLKKDIETEFHFKSIRRMYTLAQSKQFTLPSINMVDQPFLYGKRKEN